ncbi:MAG TPA: amidohydrolase family protein [Bryobacteraceae bacterium]|nr:amidohydrolase family protein [Bryobacteraceae bacterium]
MKNTALFLLVFLPGASVALAQAYRFGHVWDGEKMMDNAVIVVEKDRIQSVGAAGVAGAIDMTKYTALPGLIDVHTHMTYVFDMNQISAAGRGAAVVYLSRDNARKTLETGVTTVRNLGASNYEDIAMRDLINAGLMEGPRMYVSGYGLQITRGGRGGPQTADGPAEVMKVVRQQIGAGADVIKMYGSTGSGQDVTGFQTFTYEEIKAAVEAAHAMGKTIAIHTYGPPAARDAVRAGVDSIEHATDMDDDTIAEMARKKIFYVPTIDHNRYYVDNAKLLRYPPSAIGPLNDYIARNLETAKKAFRAGVRFAMGSDVVYTMFGENTRELGWFVKAGMTPEQALKTATVNAAELLHHENELGSLKPGYVADICAVEGNPLEDIDVAIYKVRWVMKAGRVVVDKTRP